MPKISRKSNPTGLMDIPKQNVTIIETSTPEGLEFRLARLDVAALDLSAGLRVVCVVRTGRNVQHFDLGTVGDPDRRKQRLTQASTDISPVYRVLLHEKGNPRLVASAENLRARQDGAGDSILPIRCVDLGEEIWRLQLDDGAGPALAVNSRVFSSPQETEGRPWFILMVLPQVVRDILHRLPGADAMWAQEWEAWLISELGRSLPDLDEEDDPAEFRDWVDDTVQQFCQRFGILAEFKTHFRRGQDA